MKNYLKKIITIISVVCFCVVCSIVAFAADNYFTSGPFNFNVGNVNHDSYILNGTTIFNTYNYNTSLSPGGHFAVMQLRLPSEPWSSDYNNDPDNYGDAYWSSVNRGNMYHYVGSPGLTARYYVGYIYRIALWTGSRWTFSGDYKISGSINTVFEDKTNTLTSGSNGSSINVRVNSNIGNTVTYTGEIYENGKWNVLNSTTSTIGSYNYSYAYFNSNGSRRFFVSDDGKPIRITVSCNGQIHVFNTTLKVTYLGYTITYNGNGGTPSSTAKTVERYKLIGENSPTVKRVGYLFNGWYSAASGGTNVNAKGANSTQTVYAYWTECTNHYDNNGDGICDACGKDIKAPIIDRSTYTFDQNGIDVYLHAYDNSGIARINVWVWNTNIGNYSTGQNFNITTSGSWVVNGQSFNYHYRVNRSDYQNYGTKYYSDVRVYDNTGNYSDVWTGTGSAFHTLNNVNLTMHLIFDANGGTVAGSPKYEVDWVIGASQVPPTPVRAGYTFSGWEGWNGTVPASATTYKATWEAVTITVDLNLNKQKESELTPSCTKTRISAEYLQKYNYKDSLPVPTLTDWKFDGWYTDSLGGTLITNDSSVTNYTNHTLYAHWIAVPPVLISQPDDVEVIEYVDISEEEYVDKYGTLKYPYGKVILNVAASGESTIQYLWYESIDGVNWNYISDSNAALTFSDRTKYSVGSSEPGSDYSKLIIFDVNRNHHNYQYKCMVKNNAGIVTTSPIKMTVFWLPTITRK
jgi:uncharacterized repeat protein (TIGR02543 family)